MRKRQILALCLCSQAVLPVKADQLHTQSWEAKLGQFEQVQINETTPYVACYRVSSYLYGVPEVVLAAITKVESDFNPMAWSTADALGLMQIRWPLTARHLGIRRKSQLLDPCTNVDAGSRYFRELLDRYKDDYHKALGAYNYGPTAIDRSENIPDGATRYSDRVLKAATLMARKVAARTDTPVKPENFSVASRVLVAFGSKVQAEGFSQHLQAQIPDVSLDIRRQEGGRYGVFWNSEKENHLVEVTIRLRALGF